MNTNTSPTITEYSQEEIETARSEFDRILAKPWKKRGKGIPNDWIEAFFLLLGCGIGLTLYLYWQNAFGKVSSLHSLISIGIMYGLGYWLPTKIVDAKIITSRYTFRHYPRIRKVIRAFRESGEKFRKDLPVLIVDGRKYFLVNYHYPRDMKTYGYQKRIGIVMLNESMQVVDNRDLFEKAFLTENFSYTVAPEERTKDYRYTRDKYKITKALKKSEKIIAKHKERFEEQAVGSIWKKFMDRFEILYPASDDVSTIISEVNEKIRKAQGYSFAKEFLYEDALQMKENHKAFVTYMTRAYKKSLIEIDAYRGMLTGSLAAEGKRKDKKSLLALKKIGIIVEGIFMIVNRFSEEGIVQGEEWEYHHRKVELAHELGWPISKE